MKGIEYWVIVPPEIEDPAGEMEKRTVGTGMTWKPYYGERAFFVYVPVDSDDEDVVMEQSARKVYAAFQDIDDPALDELPYPPTASEFIKFYDKQRRSTGGGKDGVRITGNGVCEVVFTVIPHSHLMDIEQAAADCDRQIAEIIAGQEMSAVIDKPIWRSKLNRTGDEVYFAAYLLGVKAQWHEDSVEMMKRIDDAALHLAAVLKDRKVYAEMDCFGTPSLKLLVEYLIPKRRGPLSSPSGGANA